MEKKHTVSAATKGPKPLPSKTRSSASKISGSQMTPSSHMMHRE